MWHKHASNKQLLLLGLLAASSVVCLSFLFALLVLCFSDINDVSALGNVKPPHNARHTLRNYRFVCRKLDVHVR